MKLLEKTGFTFLYAPLYHSAMKHAAQARRELGIKTIMNLLGPLVNPADAEYQMIGVFDEKYCLPLARAARLLGIKRALIVHGFNGLDEISVTGPTKTVMLKEDGSIEESVFDPESMGLTGHRLSELKGGDAEKNAETAEKLIRGNGPPALLDAVFLGAGASLMVYGSAGSIEEGYRKAKESIASGRVKMKIEQIRRESISL